MAGVTIGFGVGRLPHFKRFQLRFCKEPKVNPSRSDHYGFTNIGTHVPLCLKHNVSCFAHILRIHSWPLRREASMTPTLPSRCR